MILQHNKNTTSNKQFSSHHIIYDTHHHLTQEKHIHNRTITYTHVSYAVATAATASAAAAFRLCPWHWHWMVSAVRCIDRGRGRGVGSHELNPNHSTNDPGEDAQQDQSCMGLGLGHLLQLVATPVIVRRRSMKRSTGDWRCCRCMCMSGGEEAMQTPVLIQCSHFQ